MKSIKIGAKPAGKSWPRYHSDLKSKRASQSQKLAKENFYSIIKNSSLVKNIDKDVLVKVKK